MAKDKTMMLGRVDPVKLDIKGLSCRAGFPYSGPWYYEQPVITIIKVEEDPGTVYFHFNLRNGVLATLRGVYDPAVAKNVPKAKKPVTAVYEAPVGSDYVTLMVGNYNMSQDAIVNLSDKDHCIIDDIMLLMSDCTTVKTWHDEDGFVKLIRNEYAYKRNKKFRRRFSVENVHQYEGDIRINCCNVDENDAEIINVLNTITTCSTVRADVNYSRSYPGGHGSNIGNAITLFSQSGTSILMETMRDKMGFTSDAVEMFMFSFINRYANPPRKGYTEFDPYDED